MESYPRTFISISIPSRSVDDAWTASLFADMCKVLTSGLSVWRFAADEITLTRNALFRIPDRHPLVVLVLRIERVLQGDPEEAFAPYLKDRNVRGIQLHSVVC